MDLSDLRRSLNILEHPPLKNYKRKLIEAEADADTTMQEWNAYWKENNEGNTIAPMVKTLVAFINQKQPDIDDITIADELKTVGARGLLPANPVNIDVANAAIKGILNLDDVSLTDKQKAKGETVGQASGQDVQDQFDDEGVPKDEQEQIFQAANVDPNAPEIGDEGAEALAKAKTETAPREESASRTDNITSRFESEVRGSNLQKTVRLAQEAFNKKGGDLDDLEKLGAAFILVNNIK